MICSPGHWYPHRHSADIETCPYCVARCRASSTCMQTRRATLVPSPAIIVAPPTCNGHLLSLSVCRVYHTDRRWRTTEHNPPRRRRPVLYRHRRRRTTPPCLERRTRQPCESCWSALGTRWYRTMDSASTDRHRTGRLTSCHRHAAVRSSSGKYHATALRYRIQMITSTSPYQSCCSV